jgi:Tfp pilus assembly protein PilF
LSEARVLMQRALAIDEAAYGPDHPQVATNLNNLAGVLKELGDPAAARPLLERALAIDEARQWAWRRRAQDVHQGAD